MTAVTCVPVGDDFERQLAAAHADLLRVMVKSFAEALMSAEAGAQCGAAYGQASPERTNSRNGYRACEWETRVGNIEPAIRSCARARPSRNGCWSGAAGRDSSRTPVGRCVGRSRDPVVAAGQSISKTFRGELESVGIAGSVQYSTVSRWISCAILHTVARYFDSSTMDRPNSPSRW